MRACFQPNIRKLCVFEGRRRLLVLFSKVITNLCQTIFSSSEVVFELSDDGVVLDILFTAVWLFGSSLTLWRQRHPYMGDRQISRGTRAKLATMSPGTRLFHSWKLISILQNVLFGPKQNVFKPKISHYVPADIFLHDLKLLSNCLKLILPLLFWSKLNSKWGISAPGF